ncbi:MAG: indole-3-glycerol phosphate synthase TrpC [Firmicutes bacterium]|jgi:indole-3-glycerol phosphate synthase|nr:indole-3-glycerol phosphate synthase TrpC [Bacillota bacterium]
MFLEDIVAAVDRRAQQWRLEEDSIRNQAAGAPAPRSLVQALTAAFPVGVIAECKHRSPSKGWLTEAYDPVAQAKRYQSVGASALSVLTEPEYFAGSMDHLAAVRKEVTLPVLCKDFVRHPIQIWQARSHGADAVLLIVRIVPDRERLQALKDLIEELGMEALIEVHSEAELETALSLNPRLVGVNNRDLDSFETTLEFSRQMAEKIPKAITAISESGIQNAEDIIHLNGLGYRAVLVGEALMRGRPIFEDLRS